MRTNDTVACWGRDAYGQARAPAGAFKSVSAGADHTCGVRTDEIVACWGRDGYGFDQTRPPPGLGDLRSAQARIGPPRLAINCN